VIGRGDGYTRSMSDLHDPRPLPSTGPDPADLGREAQASVALILITLAVVLTISLVGLALS
jgi:hypothetical protein